jgi:hypothetical protein
LQKSGSSFCNLLILNVLNRHSPGKRFIIFTENGAKKYVLKQMFETELVWRLGE